jgi:hypothetical protein
MESSQSLNLLGAAKVHWRSFAPAWLFPIVFFYGGGASDSLGYENVFFIFVALPLFFWSLFRAAQPWLRHRIKYSHCFFWAMVVPFLVGFVALGSRLSLLNLLAGGRV